MTKRILVADDHDIVRTGIRAVLQQQPGVEVVGEAADGRTAVRLADELSPDLVLIDIGMPDLNGVDAARQILKTKDRPPRVIALSMHAEREIVIELLKAGAAGYLLKDSVGQELPAAIAAALAGKIYLSPRIANVVVEDYMRLAQSMGESIPATGADLLTLREREVLQLLAEGKTSKEMAAALHVSPKTIESYRADIMAKLKLHSVAQLTKFAIRNRLTSLDE